MLQTDAIPLYLRPDPGRQAAARNYNQAETALLTEFAERGYAIIDLELPDFDRVAHEIVTTLEPRYNNEGRIQDAWSVSPGVKELAASQQVLGTLKLLYGREPFPFQTLNFDRGTEQATHSDTVHFDCFPRGFMAGVWVALEDIDANNGPLHYFPGSHKLPQLTLADGGVFGTEDYVRDYDEVYVPMVRQFAEEYGLKAEEAYIRKGQALIWSANLLHGGSPIRQAGRSRHSQVTHYYFDGCLYYTPLHSDPLLGTTFVREPFDIRTGERRKSTYLGREVRPAPTGGRRKQLYEALTALRARL